MNTIMRRAMRLTTLVAAGFVSSACDVTNPGPVLDEFLTLEDAQQGLINGAIRAISELMGDAAYTHATLAREIFPGGQTGAWGHNVTTQGGHILPGSYGAEFDDAQQARFIAETAIQRFAEAEASDQNLYQAYLWAGISYRLMGELWCDAVVGSTDPEDPEPGLYEVGTQTYFQRAVDNFSAALTFASTDEEEDAAYAGRAQARVALGDWANAASDAAEVADDFVFAILHDESESDLYNDLYEATSGQFRSYTVQFTWFEDYYSTGDPAVVDEVTNTGDPRVPWVIDPDNDVATASLQGFPGGAVPYKPQRKYSSRDDDIRLASGWEMRLVEAEAILAQGQPFAGAMTLINQVRTRNVSDVDGATLAPWTAADATEAWTALKRERGIELWLEGRRAFDLRRWDTGGVPGEDDQPAWEDTSHPGHTPLFLDNPRSYCYDIPDSERDRNPNVPPAIGGGG